MTNTLATREFDVSGKHVTLTIRHPEKQAENAFLCIAIIEGLDDDRIEIPAGGVDGIQALLMALAAAGDRLSSSGKVRWLGMESSGLLTWNGSGDGQLDQMTWSLSMPLTPEAEAILSDSPA